MRFIAMQAPFSSCPRQCLKYWKLNTMSTSSCSPLNHRPVFFKSVSDSSGFSVTLFETLNMTHLIINSFKIYHMELVTNALVSSEEDQAAGLWRTFISALSVVIPSVPTNNTLNSHWESLFSYLDFTEVRLPTYPNLASWSIQC